MSRSIYDLELHQIEVITEIKKAESNYRGVAALRVPGGWISQTEIILTVNNKTDITSSSVFVPFSDEFKVKNPHNISDPSLM
jgi:hypothetical protein